MKKKINVLNEKINNKKENEFKKNIKSLKVKVYKTCSLVLFLLIVILTLGENVFAATTPTLVSKLNTALNKILSYLEKLAPAAAGVAIASGVMIRKFSFGDEQKMILGKKIIINALIGYVIILLIDTILKFIDGLV